MRIMYLLFPVILLLAQGVAGSSRAPRSRAECSRQKGFCLFPNCPFGFIVSGTCSRFQLCCKKIWG
uniref:Avian beta-defensin 1 n=1 Tax=Numida meleagris TaxID=8996 RepID=A0A292GM78_NUMME|nr:avian beta-defensin 1 [Numida meleagris]